MPTVYTQAGEELVTDLLDETIVCPVDWYIGWGTDGTAADKANTALGAESAESRVVGAATQPLADQNQWLGTITSSSTQTIQEAGLFSLSTGGTMLIRGNFTGIALDSGDKIEFTVQLQQS
jgi:hypothetical protein